MKKHGCHQDTFPVLFLATLDPVFLHCTWRFWIPKLKKKKKKITKNNNPVSLLADDGTSDELLHDLVGSSVDRLNSRVHKCPENTNMLMSWKKPQNNQSSLLQRLRDTNLAMGYSHMYPQPPWSCRHWVATLFWRSDALQIRWSTSARDNNTA